MPLLLVRNDIAKMETDAVVLPANPELMQGSGASRGIYQAAGEDLVEAELRQRYPAGCQLGQAVMTQGYHLPADYIIHAVCPPWWGGDNNEAEDLYSAYTSSLQLAKAANLSSIAFPLLSAGNYGYPKAEALNVANHAITDFLKDEDMDVYLVFYESETLREGSKLYGRIEALIDDDYIKQNDESYPLLRRARSRFRSSRADQSLSEISFETRQLEDEYLPAEECLLSAECLPSAEYLPQDEQRSANVILPEESVECSMSLDSFDDLWGVGVETFNQMLLRLIDESGKKPSQVYNAANISKQTFSKIKNNPDMIPTKRTIVGLAMGLELPLAESKRLLELAGYALSPAQKFDAIVTIFLNDRNYNVLELNEFLFDHGLEDQLIGY